RTAHHPVTSGSTPMASGARSAPGRSGSSELPMHRIRLIIVALCIAAAPTAAQQSVPPAVRNIIDRAPLDRAHWGIEVVDAETGEPLVQQNADRLFIPASNTKLVVTAAAAHYLPADFRYVTTLETT